MYQQSSLKPAAHDKVLHPLTRLFNEILILQKNRSLRK
jgi:hypothetical protein